MKLSISVYHRSIFSVLLFLFFTSLIFAQGNGIIKGKVTDNNSNPVPFANIVVVGTTQGAASDVNGDYIITNLAEGEYDLRASSIGYKAVTENVTVQGGETITQDFTLSQDVLNMQELVVTGTISPIPKLESSVAISTLTPRQLEQINPRSTTEQLRYVPGFTRVESSGGEVNENISVRGILGVEYVMFMEDGLPVFPTMHTFFMNADNLFRMDENIKSIEVVRGGNSALFGSNTPGAIINYINKTGGPTFSGILKLSGATEGLARYDFNFNGPISDDLRFSLGGFYRYDHGVRDPGFIGIRGGQLKANIMKILDNGYIKASLKYIDDRNQFILPLPFQNPDDPEFVPGFSDYGAMNTDEANNLIVPTPSGDLNFPLENGLRTDAYWLTTEISFDFPGDWTIKNTAQIMHNDQQWNGIFTGQPISANDWVSGLNLPGGSTFQLFYTNHFDNDGNKLPFDYSSNDGLAFLSPSQLVTVSKPMSAFQNQVQILKTINGKHTLNLGIYFANYTQTNRWNFSDILMDVRDNPRLVDLVVNSVDYTKNGFRNFNSLYRNGTGSTTILSGMLGGSFQLSSKLRADVGFRYEINDFVQDAENYSSVDLDNDPATLYNNEQWGNKSFRHFSRNIDDWAVSGGLNYKLNDQVALYAQGSRAYKMPALDEFLDGQAEDQINLLGNKRVVMFEGGIKYGAPMLSFTANAFWVELSNIIGQGFEIDPNTNEGKWVTRVSPDNRAVGAELEFSLVSAEGFNILAVATYTSPKNVEASGSALTAGGIPDIIGNLSASYSRNGFSGYFDFHYVGARDQVYSEYNTATGKYDVYREYWTIPAYHYMNLGISYRFSGEALTLALDLLNLYQSKGIEEGNPRLPGVKTYYFVARPILPRRLLLSLSYQF